MFGNSYLTIFYSVYLEITKKKIDKIISNFRNSIRSVLFHFIPQYKRPFLRSIKFNFKLKMILNVCRNFYFDETTVSGRDLFFFFQKKKKKKNKQNKHTVKTITKSAVCFVLSLSDPYQGSDITFFFTCYQQTNHSKISTGSLSFQFFFYQLKNF